MSVVKIDQLFSLFCLCVKINLKNKSQGPKVSNLYSEGRSSFFPLFSFQTRHIKIDVSEVSPVGH